jgi:hypothetical protein
MPIILIREGAVQKAETPEADRLLAEIQIKNSINNIVGHLFLNTKNYKKNYRI